ncbi:hypothetical protein Tco_0320512 [Tanacetum coccineum]
METKLKVLEHKNGACLGGGGNRSRPNNIERYETRSLKEKVVSLCLVNPKLDPLLTKLEFPQDPEARFTNTFFAYLNLRKCYANEPLAVPLDRLYFDDKLQFVEEPIEIIDREVKRLKRSRIPLVKVRWNSKRGPEFT